jgi:hypothetical protein
MPQGDDPGQGDAVRDLEYEFNLLQPRPLVPYRIVPGPLQPKCLLLTFARFGEADKSLPFVIEGIPVRQVR